MKRDRFESSRASGKSNSQVVFDAVADAEHGAMFTFENLNKALMAGSFRENDYSNADVAGIVRRANRRLLREKNRMLRSVKGRGYVIAHPDDHHELCLMKKHEGDRKLKLAFDIVRHADYGSMSPEIRKVTQGTLILVGALYQRQRQLEMRQDKLEQIIEEIRKQ